MMHTDTSIPCVLLLAQHSGRLGDCQGDDGCTALQARTGARHSTQRVASGSGYRWHAASDQPPCRQQLSGASQGAMGLGGEGEKNVGGFERLPAQLPALPEPRSACRLGHTELPAPVKNEGRPPPPPGRRRGARAAGRRAGQIHSPDERRQRGERPLLGTNAGPAVAGSCLSRGTRCESLQAGRPCPPTFRCLLTARLWLRASTLQVPPANSPTTGTFTMECTTVRRPCFCWV